MNPRHGAAALHLIAGGLMAGSAGAQGVTVYGIADVYAASVKSGPTRASEVSEGGHSASRFGLRGTERIDAQSSAYFVLEMGLTMDTGAVPLGGAWGRQSFVGLSGPWGAVELGRQYTPMFFNLLGSATFGMNLNWAPVQIFTRTDGQGAGIAALPVALRQNNAVRYRYGGTRGSGLRVDLVAAPQESSPAAGRFFGAALAFTGDRFMVGYSTQRVESAGATAYRTNAQALNGHYRIGAVTLNAAHIRTDSTAAGSRDAAHWVTGLSYEVGRHTWLAELAARSVEGVDRDARVLTLGYDHNLSKRTAVYGRLLRLENKGSAANAMALATVRANSGDDVQAIALGVRHNF